MTAQAHIQKQVAKEAGTSFVSVVRRYAEEGHSIQETALLLGYASPTPFRRMCDRHGWRDWFKVGEESIGAQRARAERRGKDTPALKAAREKRAYPTIEYQGLHDTMAGHCRRIGLSYRTAKRRQERRPGDFDYIFHCGSHVKPPKTNKKHYWRSDSCLTKQTASNS